MEKLEELKVAETNPLKTAEQPELSPEEQRAQIIKILGTNEREIAELNRLIEATNLATNDARNKVRIQLGLEPETGNAENPPSTSGLLKRKAKLEDQQKSLKEKGAVMASEQKNINPEPATENADQKEVKDTQPENANKEEDKKPEDKMSTEQETKQSPSEKTNEKIPEATIAQLSESLKKKNELQEKVSALKASPELQAFQEASQALGEKKEKLDELKKPKNSTGGGVGSVSIGDVSIGEVPIEANNNTIYINGSESAEKKEIDLAREAENLLLKMKLEILKLEKEEMEYSPEGLQIKTGELEVETKKVDAETEIWSSGDMDQKKFAENMQKINNPEKANEDFENKALFLKFKEADMEVQNHKSQNRSFCEKIDAKQEEIDEAENIAKDLECPNENKILEIVNGDKKEESSGEKNEEGGDISTEELKTETEKPQEPHQTENIDSPEIPKDKI